MPHTTQSTQNVIAQSFFPAQKQNINPDPPFIIEQAPVINMISGGGSY